MWLLLVFWGPVGAFVLKFLAIYLERIHFFIIFATGKARLYPKTIIPCRISWCIGHQSSMSCDTIYRKKCFSLSSRRGDPEEWGIQRMKGERSNDIMEVIKELEYNAKIYRFEE